MSKTATARVLEDTRTDPQHSVTLFKTDRPRSIDRYIDYFGGQSAEASARSVADVTPARPER